MTEFSIGTSGGGAFPKARTLPDGAKVRIAEVGVRKSRFERTVQSGTNKGQKAPVYQLLVVYEAQDGMRYAQYFGGVYPKDAGGYTLTEQGSAYLFIKALHDLGVGQKDRLEAYADITVTIKQVPTRNPQGGMSSQAFPASLVANAPAATPTAPLPNGGVVVKSGAPEQSAFDALTDSQRADIAEALKAGPVSPADLVDAGIAKDHPHAEAILAGAPKRNPLKKA